MFPLKQKSNTFFQQKNCVCANKKVTHFFSKKFVDMQVEGKKKGASGHRQNPVHLHKGIFVSPGAFFFLPSSFLPILGRKLFGGSKKKKPEPHHLFSLPSSQSNTLQKVFTPRFLFLFFHLPQNSLYQTHHKTRQNKKFRERERERALLGLKIGNC